MEAFLSCAMGRVMGRTIIPSVRKAGGRGRARGHEDVVFVLGFGGVLVCVFSLFSVFLVVWFWVLGFGFCFVSVLGFVVSSCAHPRPETGIEGKT